MATGITKNYWLQQGIKKKNHDIILMMARSKLNSIENLISQALIDMEISHEEFVTIWRRKINTRKGKKMWKMQVEN